MRLKTSKCPIFWNGPRNAHRSCIRCLKSQKWKKNLTLQKLIMREWSAPIQMTCLSHLEMILLPKESKAISPYSAWQGSPMCSISHCPLDGAVAPTRQPSGQQAEFAGQTWCLDPEKFPLVHKFFFRKRAGCKIIYCNKHKPKGSFGIKYFCTLSILIAKYCDNLFLKMRYCDNLLLNTRCVSETIKRTYLWGSDSIYY